MSCSHSGRSQQMGTETKQKLDSKENIQNNETSTEQWKPKQ